MSNTPETHDPEILKPISPRQLAANRANAQKSTGPKTEIGKQRARFNSLKHGLTAVHVCLPGESREDYDLRRQEYIDYFQPASLVEFDILDDLVANRWRKERIIKQERCVIYEKFMQRRPQIQDTFQEISLDVECALAVRELADNSNVFESQDRCESRVMRNIMFDWKQLFEAILTRPPVGGSPEGSIGEGQRAIARMQNEPIFENGHFDPEPVGGATQPHTIVLRTEKTRPAAATHA